MAGKIVCIFYAFIGIPLNIVMFQSIGERFNIGITLTLTRAKKCLNLKNTNITQTELTVLALFLCMSVLLGGAASFCYFENWQFYDAFYYCFITMSTIGFGDFVALQNTSMKALQTRPDYVTFSIVYILFGLTVFAAALNLMVLRLLTMNTQDERKDELEALAAAKGAVRLDGDVITPGANNTAMTPLGDDEEGMQVEADDSKNFVKYARRFQSALASSNGYINGMKMKTTKKAGSLLNSIDPRNPLQYSQRGILPIEAHDIQHEGLIEEHSEEETPSTDDFSPTHLRCYQNKKRCSV